MRYYLINSIYILLEFECKRSKFQFMLFVWWEKYSIALSDPWGLEWVIRSELTLKKSCENFANDGHSQ